MESNTTTARLEALIDLYEAAIVRRDKTEIERLCQETEQEADLIGYRNHRRLGALHTAAEQALDGTLPW